jgi:hypothetical protein
MAFSLNSFGVSAAAEPTMAVASRRAMAATEAAMENSGRLRIRIPRRRQPIQRKGRERKQEEP